MKKLFTITFLLVLAASLTFAQSAEKKVGNNVKQGNVKINKTTATNAVTYDFTTGADKYYGTNGAVELEAGVWGMIAGDANGSGIITNADNDLILQDLNQSGYYNGDHNMSGIVTNADNDLILQNLNKSTQVPN